MENERIINITESELREVLENTVNELLTHSEAEHSEEQATETEQEGSQESDIGHDEEHSSLAVSAANENASQPGDSVNGVTESLAQAAPGPVEKPSAHSSDRNITTGFIAAVREDGEGFRIRDQWYKVTGSTRIETNLAKGNKVKVYFSEGEHCVFANAIYDSAPRENAVAEV